MSKKNTKPKVDEASKYQKGYIFGFEMGKKEGRKQLQQELLNLLGAFDKFETLKDNDDD